MTVRNVTAVDPGAERVVNGRFDGPGFSSMRSTASRLHVGDLDEVFVQTVSSGDDVYGVPMGPDGIGIQHRSEMPRQKGKK